MSVVRASWQQVPVGGGGYIRHVCVHPRRPGVLFASCDVGGTFRSVDGGATWEGHAAGLERPDDFCVACIVVAADDALYAPTGGGPAPGNLYRSMDLGVTWRRVNRVPLPRLRSSGVGAARGLRHILHADPRDARHLLLATPTDGILRSLDGGETWWPLALGGVLLSGVFVAPSNPDVLFAPSFRERESDPGGVHVSADGGLTWRHAGAGLDATCVAVHPGEARTAWVSTRWDGVWVTHDGGASWSPCNGSGAGALPVDASHRFQAGAEARIVWRHHVSSVCVDPGDPRRLWASTMIHDGLFGSVDGGVSWQRLPAAPVDADGWWAGGQNQPPGPRMLATVHLVADPHRPGTLYCCDFFTVYRSDDAGRTFRACWRGMENTYVQHFWWGRPGELFLGMNDITLMRSADGGRSTWIVPTHEGIVRPWERINIGNALVLDTSRTPRRLFLAVLEWDPSRREGGVIVSDDDGATWRFLDGLPHARVHGLAQCPRKPDTLLCGVEGEGVFRTEDGGATWTRSDAGIDSPERLYGRKGLYHVRDGRFYPTHRGDIVFDPDDPAVVHLAAGEFGLYRSGDGGRTWRPCRTDVPVDYVQAIRLETGRPGSLLAACGDTGLWRGGTRDGTWTRLAAFACHALAVHPTAGGHLLAGAPGALWLSRDGGRTWSAVELGQGMMRLAALAWDPAGTRRVFVGTLGRGAFTGVLPS
jgi:hypothetical protein